MGKMLVLGASSNPNRYSYKVARKLRNNGYEVIAVGFRKGFIEDLEVLTGLPEIRDVDTVLLYMGKERQVDYYDYLLNMKPRRVIFNPGTTNPELKKLLQALEIEVVEDCALIMLNSRMFD